MNCLTHWLIFFSGRRRRTVPSPTPSFCRDLPLGLPAPRFQLDAPGSREQQFRRAEVVATSLAWKTPLQATGKSRGALLKGWRSLMRSRFLVCGAGALIAVAALDPQVRDSQTTSDSDIIRRLVIDEKTVQVVRSTYKTGAVEPLGGAFFRCCHRSSNRGQHSG